MARRARHNVEVIIGQLTSAGYRFHSSDDVQNPVTPTSRREPGRQRTPTGWPGVSGRWPLTLLSWVRLVGAHPQWAESASADPLVIEAEGSHYPGEPISGYFGNEHDVWRERAAQDPAEAGLFVLPLAPDRVFKEDVSGGPPYGLILPDGCADGLFAAETTMPFVSNLNHVFCHGGFPGQTLPHNQWHSTLGFQDAANLDDGDVWPVAYALKKWSPAVEKKVAELVKAAIS